MSGRPWLIAVTVDGVNLPRFLRRAGEMGLLLTGVRIVHFPMSPNCF